MVLTYCLTDAKILRWHSFFSILLFRNLINPPNPQQKDHHIKNWPENIIMAELPIIGFCYQNYRQSNDAEKVSQVNDENP